MRKEVLLFSSVLLCTGLLVSAVVAWPAFAGWPPCADSVRAVVVIDNIYVYHDQAEWNCCATIVFDLEAHSDTFDLYESETYEMGPCDCICCFDLLTTITGVSPGGYLVRVLAAETGKLLGEVSVEVPGSFTRSSAVSQPSGVHAVATGLGATLQSPCGGWTADVTEPGTTWGRVKAVFR